MFVFLERSTVKEALIMVLSNRLPASGRRNIRESLTLQSHFAILNRKIEVFGFGVPSFRRGGEKRFQCVGEVLNFYQKLNGIIVLHWFSGQ